MSEGMPGESWENIKAKEFRADPNSDPLERELSRVKAQSPEELDEAINETFDDLMDRYRESKDPDLLRQANLLVNRLDELKDRLLSQIEQVREH